MVEGRSGRRRGRSFGSFVIAMALVDWRSVAAGVAVAAVLAGLWLFKGLTYDTTCTSKLVATQTALDQSDGELRAMSNTDHAAVCRIYRRWVLALAAANPVAIACGKAQATRGAANPVLDAELGFYRRLVSEQCHDAEVP